MKEGDAAATSAPLPLPPGDDEDDVSDALLTRRAPTAGSAPFVDDSDARGGGGARDDEESLVRNADDNNDDGEADGAASRLAASSEFAVPASSFTNTSHLETAFKVEEGSKERREEAVTRPVDDKAWRKSVTWMEWPSPPPPIVHRAC